MCPTECTYKFTWNSSSNFLTKETSMIIGRFGPCFGLDMFVTLFFCPFSLDEGAFPDTFPVWATSWGMRPKITCWNACRKPWNVTNVCTYFSVSLPFIQDIVIMKDYSPQGCLRNRLTSSTIFICSSGMNIVPEVGSSTPSTRSIKARRNLTSLSSTFFASS